MSISPPAPATIDCPMVATLSIIGGKWKPVLLHLLTDRTMRFGELKKHIAAISQKMLTQQLRELEADGIVHRQVYLEVPPRVEYSLTAHGQTLRPALQALYHWGQVHAGSAPAQ